MVAAELMERVRDAASAGRVYGEPYEKDGLTVIPAAAVAGGGGGGGDAQGNGGGLGLAARPAGAWIIEEGKVRWMPAVDVNRIVLGGQVVAIVALLVMRSIAKARSRRGGAQELLRAADGLRRRLPRR